MTYTILLNGGKEIDIEHTATSAQLESVIKGYQGSGQWVQFITREGNYFIDSLAIQGYRPHDSATVTFGGAEPAESPPEPKPKAARKRS